MSIATSLRGTVRMGVIALAALAVLAIDIGRASTFDAGCDRSCLRDLASQVLDSMVAHDTRALPLAGSYAATENSVPSALGLMSAWRTATAATHRYYVIDPDTAQIFWISTLREGAFESLSFGRLKVRARRITEIESYLSRSRGQGGFLFSAEGAANFPDAWTQQIPPEHKASRAELLKAGRSIFDSHVESPPVSGDCLLMEDGRIVGENPEVLKLLVPPGQAISPHRNADGSVPIPCGILPDRPTDSRARTDIVDVEQGVVISIATISGVAEPYIAGVPTESAFVPDSLTHSYLDMLGKLEKSAPPSAPRVLAMPASQVVVELHRVYDGHVQGLLMLHSTQAPGARSPWVTSSVDATSPGLDPKSTESVRIVDHTETFDGLTLGAGEHLVAAPPSSLTMTVNGVGTAIQPGKYEGKVVLTVSEDIPVVFEKLPAYHFKAALFVDNGKVVAPRSVSAAIIGGTVSDTAASHIAIRSNEARFNGIMVTGKSRYRIDHANLELNGNGGNDFAGYGAAVMSSGDAEVTINHSKIVTHGAIRPGIFVGGNSTMHVNDTTIEVFNGTLPPDYKFNIDAGRMMEVPWMLGLSGNVRATNLVDHGTIYFDRSRIRAQGWGALSTDGPKHLRMYAKDTTIETLDSGYGAYSIGDSIDSFSHCRFDVADIGLIIAADGSGIFTDGTVVSSRRFGVMMHSGVGGGTLTIEKGSVFNTRSTAIQVKGRGTTIVIDSAAINAANGIILQAMTNDDPMAPKHLPPAESATGGVPPAAAAAVSGDVEAKLRNVSLHGDIINSRTSEGDMLVSLVGSRLEGAITTATAAPRAGAVPTQKTFYLIGDVKNTYAPNSDSYGLSLRLDAHSHWTVTTTSFLTRLVLEKGAIITAPRGHRIALFVDGAAVPIAPRDFSGRIELRVTTG